MPVTVALSQAGKLLLRDHRRATLQLLIAYTGSYSDYLRQREERYEQQLSAYNNQQKEIAALQQFADRFRAVPSKASQAMSKLSAPNGS